MINNIKKIIRRTQYALFGLLDTKSIRLDWSEGKFNFGDILSPIIVRHFTGKKVMHVNSKYYRGEHLLAVGSILDTATKHSIIWGSGYISEKSCVKSKPKKIYAVRGPKTRQKLLEQGIKCPEVYGDPALLMPEIYYPKKEKKYKLGVIAHIRDKDHKWLKSLDQDVLIIDIQNPNPLSVIDKILECDMIASSSLHGIIVSDAYKVPAVWIKLSDNLKGGSFKFHDYFLSVGRTNLMPVVIDEGFSVKELLKLSNQFEIDIDLYKLKENFPINLKL